MRYPGGKQRLAPFFSELIEINDLAGGHYAEPYAGGAGIALELLLSNKISHVHLNDASIHIYAFWHSILTYPNEFCQQIAAASLCIEEWKFHREVVRNPNNRSLFELGFSTFFLNRCNRSGILNAGVIGGLTQSGKWRIDARFPRNELIQRVESIALKAKSISVTNLDAEEFIIEHAKIYLPEKSLIYCDPPYYERSQGLYLNSYNSEDHTHLADTIQNSDHMWVLSYDNHREILDLYRKRRKFIYALKYSAIRTCIGSEIFIFSDNLAIPTKSDVKTINNALEIATQSGNLGHGSS